MLFVVICINWAANRNWHTNLLGRKKVAQLNSLRQERVKKTIGEVHATMMVNWWLAVPVFFTASLAEWLRRPPRDPGFESRLPRDCLGSSHTSDFKIGTPVAALPGAWRYRVSAGTAWPGVCVL